MILSRYLAPLALVVAAAPLAAQQADLAPRAKGSPTAPVTVYEMSDFQCPFCRRFALETFPALEKEYIATGKVRWVFIHYPLTQIHPNSLAASEFAACAAQQGKFWPAHDKIFATQPEWEKLPDAGGYFVASIASLGLNRAAMLRCLESGETRAMIRADAEGAVRSGARSTPTFYIEGGLLVGAQPAAVFRPILDSIIAARRR
jgi:protein-disulfide isomerase